LEREIGILASLAWQTRLYSFGLEGGAMIDHGNAWPRDDRRQFN
jgi:hypothetical protein